MNTPLNIQQANPPVAPSQNGHKAKPASAWQSCARDVLSVIIQAHEKAQYERAFFEWGLTVNDFPAGNDSQVATAVIRCHDTNEAPTQHNIGLFSGVSQDWIAFEVFARYDDLAANPKQFESNVKSLQAYARRARSLKVAETLATELKDLSKSEDHTINKALSQLASGTQSGLPPSDAGTIGNQLQYLLENDPPPLVSLGVEWLDMKTEGFAVGRSEIWGIAGRYKGRKSSVSYHIALALLKAGLSITYMSYDESRDILGLNLVSMLATEWLIERGQYDTLDSDNQFTDKITANLLYKSGNRWHNWGKLRREAVAYGLDQFQKIGQQLRIYDTTRTGGGLSDMASIRRMVHHDMQAYGMQTVFIDHLQRIQSNQEFIAAQGTLTSALQELSRAQEIGMFILAQQNEVGVKAGDNDDNDSANIKGGGSLSAAVDFLLMTRYGYKVPDLGVMPDRLKLVLKQARRTASGGNVTQEFYIHPGTGYIIRNWGD